MDEFVFDCNHEQRIQLFSPCYENFGFLHIPLMLYQMSKVCVYIFVTVKLIQQHNANGGKEKDLLFQSSNYNVTILKFLRLKKRQ